MTDQEREEALRLAEEAGGWITGKLDEKEAKFLVALIRLARAQPQQEPVAWLYKAKLVGVKSETLSQQPPDRVTDLELYNVTPLYAAPPAQPVPEDNPGDWQDFLNCLLQWFENPPHEFSAEQEDRLRVRAHAFLKLAGAPKPPGGE